MPKIALFDLGPRYDEDFWAEPWAAKPAAQQAYELGVAWNQWIISSCVEQTGGHAWWLDWDEDDGLWLHCQHCPAGVDEIYPDGQDILGGDLPVLGSSKKLAIDCGMVALDAPVQEWHGPVRVDAWLEKHPAGPWGPEEWSAGIWLEAA